MQDVAAISELLKPYAANLMRSYAVSSRVNHVANDDEECSRPVEITEVHLICSAEVRINTRYENCWSRVEYVVRS